MLFAKRQYTSALRMHITEDVRPRADDHVERRRQMELTGPLLASFARRLRVWPGSTTLYKVQRH